MVYTFGKGQPLFAVTFFFWSSTFFSKVHPPLQTLDPPLLHTYIKRNKQTKNLIKTEKIIKKPPKGDMAGN